MDEQTDSESEQLRAREAERARREAELAEQADDPHEQRAHERRADKARYLRERLEEQTGPP